MRHGLYVYAHLGDDESSFSYGKWYVKNWLTDQLRKLQDSVIAIASKPKLFQTDPFHEQLKFMARTFTLKNTGLFNERFRVYQTFWQHFFQIIHYEMQNNRFFKKRNSPEASIFIAFFHVLQGRT